MTATADDPRWDAIVRRDPAAEGKFLSSVATTGVYCRPSCGARRPRVEHVAFHDNAGAAEREGFRPCKRCEPHLPPRRERQVTQVAALCRFIEARVRDEGASPSVADLAAEAGWSASHTQRTFKAVMGMTPKAFVEACRAERMRDELKQAESVTDAIYASGFGSSSRFYDHADDALGMTPRAFRAGGAQETVRFALGQCSLGAILVAATERGVCALYLDDDPAALVRELERSFPAAELVAHDERFDRWVAIAVSLVDRPHDDAPQLPLDIRGTAFQRRVWDALRRIPPGATASYAEIAERIGAPRSSRAVGRACATNQVAVAIPCHRVVRSDGSLSGYRWGLEKKRRLLELEAAETAERG